MGSNGLDDMKQEWRQRRIKRDGNSSLESRHESSPLLSRQPSQKSTGSRSPCRVTPPSSRSGRPPFLQMGSSADSRVDSAPSNATYQEGQSRSPLGIAGSLASVTSRGSAEFRLSPA